MKVICPDCLKSVEKKEFCDLCEARLILNERYYLLKIIGQNIGVTYQASDQKTKNRVVIKELSIKKLNSWKDEELFKREASALMSINHDEIPDFIDYFEISVGKKVKYYTVMEFIYGETLRDRMEKINFTEYKVIELITEITKILDYLHNLTPPVIHRDLKPTNIVKRKKDGKFVLIDFGAVVDALKPEGDSTVAGTFGYMAPEQFMGKAVSKSDYYSLGVIALELITKKKHQEFLKGVKLDWKGVTVSDYMRKLLNALLAENPSNRIGSLKELLNIIEEEKKELRLQREYDESKAIEEDRVAFFKMYKELKSIEKIRNIGFISSLFKRKKKFLIEYFSKLTEKEVIFLEMILKSREDFFLITLDDFYSLYQDAVDKKTLDINLLIKYSELYKDNHKFKIKIRD